MDILAFLVLGGVAGWIASMIMRTDEQEGIALNVVVGVVGSFLAGTVFNAFGSAGVTGFNFYSLLVATLGAVALLWIVRIVRKGGYQFWAPGFSRSRRCCPHIPSEIRSFSSWSPPPLFGLSSGAAAGGGVFRRFFRASLRSFILAAHSACSLSAMAQVYKIRDYRGSAYMAVTYRRVPPFATPTPLTENCEPRILFRCPVLFIHAATTCAAASEGNSSR